VLTRIIPPRPIRDVARDAATSVRASLRSLQDWGVKALDDSRLHQALDVLDPAASNGILIPSHRGDQLGLRALELAYDYDDIAATLPSKTVAAVRRELEQSLVGSLEPSASDRRALQLQSQFIVRGALVLAGLDPRHPLPRSGGKSPDLVIENAISEYGIEVKRPEFARNVLPRMMDARDQLDSYGLQGAVVIDVADCLRGHSGDKDEEVQRLGRLIYEEVFAEGQGNRPGYSGIIMSGAFARIAWTSEDGEADSMVSVHTSALITIYARRRNTLQDLRARWLRDALWDGLLGLGGVP
jgi:hypothetical protein